MGCNFCPKSNVCSALSFSVVNAISYCIIFYDIVTYPQYFVFVAFSQSQQEQIECLNMKDETLTSSFHFMQEEHLKLQEQNKVTILSA